MNLFSNAWLASAFWLLWNTVPLVGQTLVLLQPKVQWNSGQILIPGQEMEHRMLLLDRGFRVTRDLSFPKGLPDFPETSGFLFQDEPWVFSHRIAQSPKGNLAFDQLYRFREGRWQLVASHEEAASLGGFEFIEPLKNGRFFGVRRGRLRNAKGLECPFYLIALDENGTLKTASVAETGLDGKVFSAPGLPFPSDLIRVGDYFVVLDQHPGWMWVFNAENGGFKRLVRIYEELDEKRLMKNNFSTVIVGAQAEENGNLLLAVRSASAALSDDSAMRLDLALRDGVLVTEGEEGLIKGKSDPQEVRGQELMDSAWKHHPEVRWIRFDPATGHLKECEVTPQGARTRISSMVEFATFRWIPDWDGRVEFRTLTDLITTGERAAAKEKLEKEKTAELRKKSPQKPSAGTVNGLK